MREHDILVLGGGTGNVVASAAAEEEMDVGLVERDRLGGTCLNRGCNPSKQLVRTANAAETVRNADRFGVDASLDGVAFEQVVDAVADRMTELAESKAERARESDHLTFYQAEGRFVGDHTIDVDASDERLTADRVVFAGGSRPMIPDSIDGTDYVDVRTSADVLQGKLDELPDRLVIVGGGYVAVELSHVFSQMGAEVAIVGHSKRLVDREDPAIAERLTDVYREKHDLALGYEATEIAAEGGERVVVAESENGDEIRVAGDQVLVATGRQPNSDRWNVSATEIETDERGFVRTDQHLETTVEGVWAIGDIAGNHMFKHAGDKEAEYVVANAVRDDETEIQYPGMAHAIFGSPEIGSLGRTEDEIEDGTDYDVGTFAYEDHALGSVLAHDGGFVKAIVADDGEILGVHIVGPEASTLIHEVSTAVAAGGDATTLAETIHVHPALSEVVQGAFRQVRDVTPSGI